MRHRYLEIASTPSVKAAQEENGSRGAYARFDSGDEPMNDRLTERERDFIAARDSFFMASVSETGWPYVQHRGGPAGFLQVLDDQTLAFADFAGNRQYISLGNLAADGRVSLFLLDHANRRRLKIYGRATTRSLQSDTKLALRVATPGYKAKPERIVVIVVEAYDWNCPQHITPRFTEAEIETASAPLHQRLAELESENARLRGELAGGR